VKTLADNNQFRSIMQRSVGTKGERPQVSWFVDPIELVSSFLRQNVGGQVALAMLPALGLDGIKAAGGSIIFATEQFDSISYLHVLLDNPRQGVLKMLAIKSGDPTPENWVPVDSASYISVYWDLEETLAAFRELYNTMRGDGALSADIQRRLSDPLQIDVERQILQQLDDRIIHVQWLEKPARLNSGTTLLGVRLKDPAAVRQTLGELKVRFPERLQEKSTQGTTYFAISPRRERRPEGADEQLVRRPSPCVTVLGDYLLVSDSVKCLQAAIANKKDPSKSLADELDFKLIASKAEQYRGSDMPGMFTFSRPEETLRSFYELATSPAFRRSLSESAENNRVLKKLDQALRDHPLPPFSTIAKYLAPEGATLVSDQSGLHYMAFSLKRQN
jgi:hypothetical protein